MSGADRPGGGVRLLLVGRPATLLAEAAGLARAAGAEVDTADGVPAALMLLRSSVFGLVMIDVAAGVPGFIAQLAAERFAVPVLACGIDAPAAQAVAAIRAGARDYVPLPPDRALIAAAIAAAVPAGPPQLVGEAPAFRAALALACQVAPSRAPVLLAGEPGTGRASLARRLHDASRRRGRFVAIECAGVPEQVLDSELLGHEAGAFPGAVAPRRGGLEMAVGGTLFLNGVDRLAPPTQARLARALADGASLRIGGRQPHGLDARLVASSSVDLGALVADGRFRADLAARLSLLRVTLPPLRERAGDVALLVPALARRLAAENGFAERGFAADALALLAAHHWPGNVRELEDVVHRALLLTRGPVVEPEALVLADGTRLAAIGHAGAAMGTIAGAAPDLAAASGGADGPAVAGMVGRTVADVERELILRTLERCRGNRTSASSVLGISVRTMRNKLKTFVEAGIPVSPAV